MCVEYGEKSVYGEKRIKMLRREKTLTKNVLVCVSIWDAKKSESTLCFGAHAS